MADQVSTNVLNEKPAIEADELGSVYIVDRYLPGGSGLYQIILYKKTVSGSFTSTVIHEE